DCRQLRTLIGPRRALLSNLWKKQFAELAELTSAREADRTDQREDKTELRHEEPHKERDTGCDPRESIVLSRRDHARAKSRSDERREQAGGRDHLRMTVHVRGDEQCDRESEGERDGEERDRRRRGLRRRGDVGTPVDVLHHRTTRTKARLFRVLATTHAALGSGVARTMSALERAAMVSAGHPPRAFHDLANAGC